MNNQRRKQINSLIDDLDRIKREIDELAADEQTGDVEKESLADKEENWSSRLDDIRTEIESIKDDEQEYFDNMPEGLQSGERGTQAEDTVNALDFAEDHLDELVGVEETGTLVRMFHEKYDDISANLEEASS